MIRAAGRLAGAVFLLTWIPLSVWRGLAVGRTFRIGPGADGQGPLVDGIITAAAAMLAPAALAALVAFVGSAWLAERRARRVPR